MTKKPYLNALAAAAYILIIVTVLQFTTKLDGADTPFIAPVAMLSLFVFSAALMGFLFLSQPLQLYLDGNKKEGVKFFLQTAASFAGISLIVLGILLMIF